MAMVMAREGNLNVEAPAANGNEVIPNVISIISEIFINS